MDPLATIDHTDKLLKAYSTGRRAFEELVLEASLHQDMSRRIKSLVVASTTIAAVSQALSNQITKSVIVAQPTIALAAKVDSYSTCNPYI